MENCKFKELKGNVQNNSLLKLDEILLSNPSLTNNYDYYFERVGDAQIRLIKGTGSYKVNEGTETALQSVTVIDGTVANNFRIILNPGAKCTVNCKYSTTCTQVDEVFDNEPSLFNPFDDKYKYMSILRRIRFYGTGNCDVLGSNVFVQLVIGGKDVTGIDSLIEKNKGTLQTFYVPVVGQFLKNVSTQYNFSKLALCPNLTTLQPASVARGTIEDYVATAIENGITSGERTINNTNQAHNITYQDTELAELAEGHRWGILNWDSSANITLTFAG